MIVERKEAQLCLVFFAGPAKSPLFPVQVGDPAVCPLQVGFSLQRPSVFKDRFLTLASPGQGLRLELMGPIRIRIELFDWLVETLCRFTIGLRPHVLRVCPFGRSRGNGLQLSRSVFILSQCEQRGTQPEVGLGQVGLYSERASQGHKSLLEPSDSIITDTEKQRGSPLVPIQLQGPFQRRYGRLESIREIIDKAQAL